MNNQKKYEQMASDGDSNIKIYTSSFSSSSNNAIIKATNSDNSKITKWILVIVMTSIFGYLIYSLIAKSSQLKKDKSELLTIDFEVNKFKAESNDLLLKKNKLNQDSSNISKEKKKLEINIKNAKLENGQLQESIDNRINQMNSLKSQMQLVQVNKDKKDLIEELNNLEPELKSWNTKVNILRRQKSNKREEIDTDPHKPRPRPMPPQREEPAFSTIINRDHVEIIKRFLKVEQYELIFELCYRATRDGLDSRIFHNKCDGRSHTITFYKINDNNIIGGFTTKRWDSNGYIEDRDAFVFNLISQKKYPVKDYERAIYTDIDYLPSFGNGDIVYEPNGFGSQFPRCYGEDTVANYELTLGLKKLQLEELEVFGLTLGQ